MTDDLTGLLEELRVVDEETWNAIYIRIMAIRGIMPADDDGQDIIQGCIQRAIAANEWQLTQLSLVRWFRPCPYQAAIRTTPNENWISGFGETPATAILAAYIAAKKAMQ